LQAEASPESLELVMPDVELVISDVLPADPPAACATTVAGPVKPVAGAFPDAASTGRLALLITSTAAQAARCSLLKTPCRVALRVAKPNRPIVTHSLPARRITGRIDAPCFWCQCQLTTGVRARLPVAIMSGHRDSLAPPCPCTPISP